MATTKTRISTFHVGITLAAPPNVTREDLEAFAFEVERVLMDHACGEQFGASVACNFDPMGVEIDLAIDAVSLSLVNRRVSEIMSQVEQRLPVQGLQDQQIVEQSDEAVSSDDRLYAI